MSHRYHPLILFKGPITPPIDSHPGRRNTKYLCIRCKQSSVSSGPSLLILAIIHASRSYLLENGAKPCTQSTPYHRYTTILGGFGNFTSSNVCFTFQETVELEKGWIFILPWHYLPAPHRGQAKCSSQYSYYSLNQGALTSVRARTFAQHIWRSIGQEQKGGG